jgi:MFS family permease
MNYAKVSTKNFNVPINTPFYYGWIVVIISAISLFFSGPGQTYFISIFIDSYIEQFGWSRSLVSTIYSFATLLSGSLLFLMGRLVDRFGQRIMTLIVGFLLGITCIWNSYLTGPVMLFIGFFMLRFWGQGSLVLLPNTLVPQWFIKQRGRSFSFLNIGGFVGAFTFPPLNAWMIYTWGWPATWRIWAVVLCIGFAPLAYYLIRNKPEDVGLLPDSPYARSEKHAEEHVEENRPLKHLTEQEENWTLQEAMRTRAFWLILFCTCILPMIITGIVFHLFSILAENGLSKTAAPLVLAIMPFISFPITFIIGLLLERYKLHYVITIAFLLQIVSLTVLLYSNSIEIAILFAVIQGLVGGVIVISLGVVWPNYFGRKHIGSIKSVAMTAQVIASACGPLPFGIAFDYFGGYTEIIIIMAVFPLLAMFAAFFSPAPRKKEETN